ncbi:MAG: MFS transporter [Alphaproteobacteria bacterium]|nr:MFS transporter [Alphaproteobacteria bacterium]
MLVPLIVACALFMENLDGTVISTALPQIARSLDVSPIRLSLAITSYLLSLAIFIPVSGWLADRFGARTIFRSAIVVFTLGSILCGVSTSLVELTASRFLQGVGGAMMVPVGRLVMVRSVNKAELVRAMAYLTAPALLGPVLGPPVGGFLVTYASWRWIFFLNVPIGLIGIVLVSIFIENRKEPDTPPLDRVGFALSGLALAGIMIGCETIGREGVPLPIAAGLLATGFVLGAFYLWHASVREFPILDLRLFRVPTFAIAVGGGMPFRIGVGALPFLLPLMLQVGFGMTAFASGLLTFTAAMGAMFMKLTARPILHRLGFRPVLAANAVLCGAFFVSYGMFQATTPAAVIVALLLAGGFFRSLQFTAINALTFADLDSSRMSRATSLSSTVQQVSLSIGVAVGAGLLHATLAWRAGGAETGLVAADFWPAFVGIGALTAASAFAFACLKPDAGAEVAGRLPAAKTTVPAAAAKQPAAGE